MIQIIVCLLIHISWLLTDSFPPSRLSEPSHPPFMSFAYPPAATIKASTPACQHTTNSTNNDDWHMPPPCCATQLLLVLSVTTHQLHSTVTTQLLPPSPLPPSNFTPKPLPMRFRSKHRSFFRPGDSPARSYRNSWGRKRVGGVGEDTKWGG